ncbi:hypothetical protein HY798_01670 [Candidatus Falkowbacteria bacterium]|nr:hypothetical protein [Candidatus Falkowbacteria bacterium]
MQRAGIKDLSSFDKAGQWPVSSKKNPAVLRDEGKAVYKRLPHIKELNGSGVSSFESRMTAKSPKGDFKERAKQ